MAASDTVQVIAPASTKVTFLSPPPSPVQSNVIRSGQLRVPRSAQLKLARTLTFGVLGEDSNLYPSSRWVSEKQDTFAGRKSEETYQKPEFVITSLDTRKHNPQPKQIFHIKRINKKPVCNVQTWVSADGDTEKKKLADSVYKVSFKERPPVPVHIIHRDEKDKPIEGIVPINISGSKFDVRAEMMLPVCDATNMPSAPNPHRYLLRKRKVPPPFNTHVTTYTRATSGIVYPNLEHSRMTSYVPGSIPTGSLPFPNETTGAEIPKKGQDRISVSTLSGQDFSRRKYIQPPSGHISCASSKERHAETPDCVSSLAGQKFTRRRLIDPPEPEIYLGFNGAVPETTSNKFDDKYLPFIRAKTII